MSIRGEAPHCSTKKCDESVYAFECFFRGEAPHNLHHFKQTTMDYGAKLLDP
jgi:hypothetical protein